MKFKTILALCMILGLVLSGCGVPSAANTGEPLPVATGADEGTASDPQVAPTSDASVQAESTSASDLFTNRDYSADYDAGTAIRIELNADTASCASDAVQISGSTVTITDGGAYILAGTLNDGSIVVRADQADKPQLILNGVSITSKTSAAIYIQQADKVIITLSAGSENTLSSGDVFTATADANIDGTVFSAQDLTFNGSGRLSIASPAGHGIVCKDDLVFTGGDYSISAAAHGIDANDSVRVTAASLTIAAGKDGIHTENTDDASLGFIYVEDGSFDIDSGGDGMSAGAYMQIEDGSFAILSGGGSANAVQKAAEQGGGFGGHGGMGRGQRGEPVPADNGAAQELAYTETAETDSADTSMKGLKAGGDLTVNGGAFTIDAADDTVHANGALTVNGGAFTLKSGDDGFHADETLTVAGGTIRLSECYEGLEGLHVDITGGDVSLVARDDGLNAAGGTDQSGFGGSRGQDTFGQSASAGGSITISGGTLYINASGDGLDANGSLEISGGDIIVSGPTTGDTAVLDYDTAGIITGGTFIGTGALQMAQSFSSSEQGVVALNAGNQSAGTMLTLTDSTGTVVLSRETDQAFTLIILSSPDLHKGETYTLAIGTATQEVTAQ